MDEQLTEQLNSETAEEEVAVEVTATEQKESVSDGVENAAVSDAENTENSEKPKGKGKGKGKNVKTEEALKKFEGRTVEPPKKSKYGWLGYVLLAVAISLGIWAMFGIAQDMGETQSFGSVIASSDWRFALIFLAVILAILACDWMKYSVIMKTTTGKFNLRTSLKVQLLGKFYDNVTPFAVGGQPMQIYYLHKKGYSGGVSSAVVLIKYFTQMFCMCTISLLLLACNTDVLMTNQNISAAWRTSLMVGAWIGLTANMFLPIMVLLFVLLPKFAHKLASFVIAIGYKLKIVKDKQKAILKAVKTVDDFRNSFKIMSQKPFNFIVLILLCIAEVLLRFALPFFVMKMFSAPGVETSFSDLIAVMALNVYATQSVAIIPTPGNSGAIESTGTIAFSAFITGSVLSWSVFAWRLSVFYIYIIIGLGIMVFEFIRKLVRRRLQRRQ